MGSNPGRGRAEESEEEIVDRLRLVRWRIGCVVGERRMVDETVARELRRLYK